MPAQIRNSEQVELLASDFQKRNDPGFAWGRAVSSHLFLPQLMGFWPYSALDGPGGNVLDITRNQDMTNTTAVTFALQGIAPYGAFNGSHYLTTASATPNRITDGLTLGAYVRFSALGSAAGVISKWESTGNQRCYRIYKDASDNLIFEVSSNGTGAGVVSVTSSETLAVDTWYRVIGEYNPSTSLNIWVNGTNDENTTAIPAAIFDSATSALQLGRTDGGNNLSGRESLAFLCASAINSTLARILLDYSRMLFGIRLG